MTANDSGNPIWGHVIEQPRRPVFIDPHPLLIGAGGTSKTVVLVEEDETDA